MRFLLRHRWLVLSLVLLAVCGLQSFVVWQIERQVLEPVNHTQGGLSVADDVSASTRQLDPEAFEWKWFSEHHAIKVPEPDATLHVWRFDPMHQQAGPTDVNVRATVLMMPGWGGTAMRSMYPYPLVMICRKEGCRVLLVDLRGQGCSTGDTCSYGYLDAKDLAHMVTSLRSSNIISGPVLLAGHSYGAIAALQAAPVLPNIVGVIACSGPQDLLSVAPTARFLAKQSFPWLYPIVRPFFSNAAFRFAVTRDAHRHGFEAEQSSALHAIQQFTGSVFIAQGDQDLAVPPSNATAIQQARPEQTTLHVFPGADHWSYLLDENNLSPVVEWLRTVLASASGQRQSQPKPAH